MCELLAISASTPVDIRLSLAELAQHGGATDKHADGWGVAYLEGRDVRLFREPVAAATSPWIRCLQSHPIRSDTVVAHVRRATSGEICLANTQPFVREFAGTTHVFAHNGHLGAAEAISGGWQHFQPLGETDSEAAFCLFMNRLAESGNAGGYRQPNKDAAIFAGFSQEMRSLGPANIIHAADGRLLVHADRRTQLNGVIEPPGLWMLQRHCNPGHPPFHDAGVSIGGSAISVVLVASVPLSTEAWQPLPQGTILVVEHGLITAVSGTPQGLPPASSP